MEELFTICNGIEYTRQIPKEAKQYAKENGFIIIVGGSDDLMYCYGSKSYMTDEIELSYGWDGGDFSDTSDEQLRNEAHQLGLKVWWCGEIKKTKEKIDGYDVVNSGAFSYSVKDGIEYKNFIVYEDEKHDEVYCTGIIIKMPENFKPCMKEN